ncbi:MAG: DUF58 domain-containing protein [Hominimerdicola sp.]
MLVLYIFIFITGMLFYILYVGNFSFYLFAFLLIIPLVLLVMQIYLSRKIQVTFCGMQKNIARSSRMPVTLKVTNPAKIPVANLIIEIEYGYGIDKQRSLMKINTPIYPKNTQYLTLQVTAKHYGSLKMRIKRCRVCDMLNLFKIKVKTPLEQEICRECSFTVTPDYIPIENNIADYSETEIETNEYSKHRKGDDPSEVFDIHEYIEGDKINRIHWKLSMKQDKTMVKDYSLPISNSIVLAVNLNIDSERKGFMGIYDTLMETVCTISGYLVENEIPHKIIWHDCLHNELIEMNISDDEEYSTFVAMILQTPLYDKNDLTMINYINEDERCKCGHLMYFSADYNENLSGVMNDSDLANKYTYMLISDSQTENGINDMFADVVPIYRGRIAQSVEDICL